MVGKGMSKLKENTTELIISCIFYIAMMGYFYFVYCGNGINFIDTDDFMKVVSIREFFSNFDLNNHIISRCNYPHGCELHWTRLYDFLIIGLTWIVDLFTDSLDQSINYVCYTISPLIGLVCTIFLFKIFGYLLPKNNILLATVLFFVSPLWYSWFSFGRPDHHAFLTLCLLIYIYYIIKVILNHSKDEYTYLKPALAATACVWASPETLVVILVTNAILFLSFLRDFEKTLHIYFTNLITACFVGTVAMIPEFEGLRSYCIVICIFLLLAPYTAMSQQALKKSVFFRYWHYICLIFIWYYLTQMQPVEYDKISIVHVSLFLCLAVLFAINMQLIGRKSHIYDAILWSIVIGVIFLCMFPRFLMGMSANVPKLVKDIWLSKVNELQSPFSGETWLIFSVYIAINVTAIIVKTQELRKQKLSEKNVIWIIFIALATCYLILGCFAYRMIPYSVIFGMPIVVNLGMSSKYVKNLHRLLRMIITMFISCLFILVLSWICRLFYTLDPKDLCKYSDKELYECIDNLSYSPAVIMSHSNDGPKLLYYTKHYAIGAPYHRQTEGIIASYVVTQMKSNLSEVRKFLKKTDSQFIFISRKLKDLYPKSFSAEIISGQLPKWLTVVEIPEKFSWHCVFKIDQELLSKEIEENGDFQSIR